MKKLTHQTQEVVKTLRAKVAHRREYLDILEMELSNTRLALQEFTILYRQRLSPLEDELSRLEQILDEGTRLREQERSANGAGKTQEQTEDKHKSQHHRRESRLPSTKNPLFERKIRELFRNLAKRFHPDLTDEQGEKKQREEIMSRINQAYSARDLKALETLAEESAAYSSKSAGPEEEIVRLKIELRHLEAMIFEVEHTIRELDISPAMQLCTEAKIEENAGRDLFGDMEFDLKLRIAELQEHLLDLGLEVQ